MVVKLPFLFGLIFYACNILQGPANFTSNPISHFSNLYILEKKNLNKSQTGFSIRLNIGVR